FVAAAGRAPSRSATPIRTHLRNAPSMTEAVTPGSVAAPTAAADAPTVPFSKAYTGYVMWLLLGIYIINFLDRQVLNILIEDIKLELHLTDTQMGLLGGLAFAIFYTILGIPIARLA